MKEQWPTEDALKISVAREYEIFVRETDASFDSYREKALAFIQELTEDKIRERGFRHPDGFIRMSIGPEYSITEGQVRLHFWRPGHPGTGEAHSHPWHLASEILYGSYSEYRVAPELDAAGNGLRKFQVRYPADANEREGVSEIETEHRYKLGKSELLTYTRGQRHYLPSNTYHLTVPDPRGAITLSVMSPRLKSSSEFLAHAPTPYDSAIQEEDIEQVMQLASGLKGALREA